MARQLVWLKWRLLANGLRTDRQRRWGLPVIAIGLSVIAALGAQFYYDTSRSLDATAAAEFGIWLSVIGWVGWATLPVLIFPIDETLDPAKFATLPMTRWRMMIGLTGAAMLTPPIIVPILVIVVNLALWSGWVLTPVTIIAVVLIIGSYVIGGQAFTTAFSMLIKSRRGRDLTMLFVVGLGLVLYGGQSIVADAIGALGLEGAKRCSPARSSPGHSAASSGSAISGTGCLPDSSRNPKQLPRSRPLA
jgi:ABC-2 type transport system permease protein